jgi:hypothetical protein
MRPPCSPIPLRPYYSGRRRTTSTSARTDATADSFDRTVAPVTSLQKYRCSAFSSVPSFLAAPRADADALDTPDPARGGRRSARLRIRHARWHRRLVPRLRRRFTRTGVIRIRPVMRKGGSITAQVEFLSRRLTGVSLSLRVARHLPRCPLVFLAHSHTLRGPYCTMRKIEQHTEGELKIGWCHCPSGDHVRLVAAIDRLWQTVAAKGAAHGAYPQAPQAVDR